MSERPYEGQVIESEFFVFVPMVEGVENDEPFFFLTYIIDFAKCFFFFFFLKKENIFVFFLKKEIDRSARYNQKVRNDKTLLAWPAEK